MAEHPVAKLLRVIARQVDAGDLRRLKLDWDGGVELDIVCDVPELLTEVCLEHGGRRLEPQP